VPASLFVDSGAWLAYFSSRDGRHPEADRLIREALRRKIPLFTTDLVLAEVHRLLLFRAGIKPAFAALDVIDRSPSVSVDFATATLHREARAWLARFDDQVISYTDATSFALMTVRRCKVAISFDHDFVIAGFALWEGEP
jgi:predicted nucleic acid-binding protein